MNLALNIPIVLIITLIGAAVAAGAAGAVPGVVEDIRSVGNEETQNPGESDQDGSGEVDESDGSPLQEPQFESPPSVAAVDQTKTFKANIQASEQVLTQARFFTSSEPPGAGAELQPEECSDDNSLVSECTIQKAVEFKDLDSDDHEGYNLIVETQFETDAESSTQLETKIATTEVGVVEIKFEEVGTDESELPENLQGGGNPTIRADAAADPDTPILEGAELTWDTDTSSISGPDDPYTTSCTGRTTGVEAVGPGGAKDCDIQQSFEFPPGEYSAEVEATFDTTEGPVTSTETIQVTPGPGLTVTVFNNNDDNPQPVENAMVRIKDSGQSGRTNADGKVNFNDLGEGEIQFDVKCDDPNLESSEKEVVPTSTVGESIDLLISTTDCSE